MKKEEFIYEYMLAYNKYEQKFNGKTAVDFWRDYDKKNGTSGLIFMALRNELVHNTYETMLEIESINPLALIIQELKNPQLKIKERMKYLNFFLKSKKMKLALEKKKFEKISVSDSNFFKIFQKKYENLYGTLFFSHKELLFEVSVSTFDHQKGCKNLFDGYYIESELCNHQYIINFFKSDANLLIYSVKIYIDKDFNPKNIFLGIEMIEVSIITVDSKENKNFKLSQQNLENYDRKDFNKFFNEYLSNSTVITAVKKIKQAYEQLNDILHIIGINI